jgi:predicted nucleic acid-binding protein
MGPLILLDTNVVIYHAGGQLAAPLAEGEYLVSVISEIEAMGCRDLAPDAARSLKELFSCVTIVPLDDAIKEETIRLRQTTRLRLPDAIIVATCLVTGAELLTHDSDLLKVPGLKASAPVLKV